MIDVTIAPELHVGYIMGVGDEVPQAIEQLGRASRPDRRRIRSRPAISSRYNVIVTGVRAYERRPDLRANNQPPAAVR